MRVLLACPYAWDAPGGVQVHVRQLAGALERRGHDVLVVAPGGTPATEPFVRIVGRTIRIPYAGTVAPLCFSRRAFSRIRRLVRVFEPHVVHVHEPLTPSVSMLATFAAATPVVATFHAHLDRSRLMKAVGPALRTVFRRIAAPVAVSEAAAEFVGRVAPGPVEIVPNGVEVGRFADPGPPAAGLPPGRRILWVNRLDPQKGFPVAVRAFGRLAGELDGVALVVAGDGADRDAVAMLEEGLRARVVLLGTVPHDRLPAYHASADVLVAAATGQESFGIVLVEAMAAGMPVVATDIAGYREVVRDGVEGLLVPPNDPGALAAALRRVLTEDGLAERLGSAGRDRAKSFDWDVIAPRLEAIYERVAGD